MSKKFCFAANGPVWGEFFSKNAHVARLSMLKSYYPEMSYYTSRRQVLCMIKKLKIERKP